MTNSRASNANLWLQGADLQIDGPVTTDGPTSLPSGDSLEEDGPGDRFPPDTIPNEADFLVGYATLPGYVSFRSRTHGSWYVTKLVEMLDRYAQKYVPDMATSTMLVIVSPIVWPISSCFHKLHIYVKYIVK